MNAVPQEALYFHSAILQAAAAVFAITGTVIVFIKSYISVEEKKYIDIIKVEMHRINNISSKYKEAELMAEYIKNNIRILDGEVMATKRELLAFYGEFRSILQEGYLHFKKIEVKGKYGMSDQLSDLESAGKRLFHLTYYQWYYPIPQIFILLGASMASSALYLWWPQYYYPWLKLAADVFSLVTLFGGVILVGVVMVSIYRK